MECTLNKPVVGHQGWNNILANNRNKEKGKQGAGGMSRGAKLAVIIGCSAVGAMLAIFVAFGVYMYQAGIRCFRMSL